MSSRSHRAALGLAAGLLLLPGLGRPEPDRAVAGPAFEPLDPPPAEAVLADLAFLDARPNEVRIDLAAPGRPPLALSLDTGSPNSFATVGAARGLGISLRRLKRTPYRRATRLDRSLELWVDTRRSDTGSEGDDDFAVIGASFLQPFVVELDFPARRVRFFDASRYQLPDAATRPDVLRLAPDRSVPVIEIQIGEVAVPAVVSTGAPGTLILPGGWAEAAEARVRPDPEARRQLELPSAARGVEPAVAEVVRVGPFEEREVPLLVAPQGFRGAGARSDAILGVDLLRRFVVRIDFPRERLWIAEGDGPATASPAAD